MWYKIECEKCDMIPKIENGRLKMIIDADMSHDQIFNSLESLTEDVSNETFEMWVKELRERRS